MLREQAVYFRDLVLLVKQRSEMVRNYRKWLERHRYNELNVVYCQDFNDAAAVIAPRGENDGVKNQQSTQPAEITSINRIFENTVREKTKDTSDGCRGPGGNFGFRGGSQRAERAATGEKHRGGDSEAVCFRRGVPYRCRRQRQALLGRSRSDQQCSVQRPAEVFYGPFGATDAARYTRYRVQGQTSQHRFVTRKRLARSVP